MSAIFRKIHISIWQDEFFLKLEPLEKYFFLYLLTNSKTNQCGIYRIPLEIIEFDTGLKYEQIKKYLEKFITLKKIRYNPEESEIMIINWIKHNGSKSSKVITCVQKELWNVKTSDFIDYYYILCDEYGYSIDTLPKKEEEREQGLEEYIEEEGECSRTPTIEDSNYLNIDFNIAKKCYSEIGPNCQAKDTPKGLKPECDICLIERKNWK